jgi:hypothetical protein
VLKVSDAPSGCDFNGDGNTDIVLRNTIIGQNIIWYLNGPNWIGGDYLPMLPGTNWIIGGLK